jgi:hypothetical protein
LEKGNRNSFTIGCFSHSTVTGTLNLVTEIVTFIFKDRRWMKIVIHIFLRIIKIFTLPVALELRVSEVSKSKNEQECRAADLLSGQLFL